MELFFEVIIIDPETACSHSYEFDSVVNAYEYANELKKLGFEPLVARIYRVKA